MTERLFVAHDQEPNVVGAPLRADGWYGAYKHLHTVIVHANNFVGSVRIEASIFEEPSEDDWFDVVDPIVYGSDKQINGTVAKAASFDGVYRWIRMRSEGSRGFVDRALINL